MSRAHLIFIFVIMLLWGVNFAAIAVAVEDFPPILANGLRFMLVLVLLLPYLRRPGGQMPLLFAIAFLLGVVHFGTVFLAMAVATDMSPIAIVAQTNVPFATILAVLFLGERIGFWRISGILLSFVGVIILGFEPGGFDQIDAIALTLFSAFAYACTAILMRRIKAVHPMTVQAWVAAAAVPGSLLLSLGLESGQMEALYSAPWQAYAAIAYSAIAASIIGHGGMYYLFQRYEVTTVAPFILLAPLFAVLSAVLFLGESLSRNDIIGGVITLAGVLIITLRAKSRQAMVMAEES